MKRILIADDDISIVDTMAGILRQEGGFEVETAMRYDEILEKVDQFQPDLVTLDLKFGAEEELGITILRDIRSRYQEAQLPVIIISGTGDTVKLQELQTLGIHDYLHKPINAEELIETINSILADGQTDASLQDGEKIIGGKKMMDLLIQVGRLAKTESDMLVLGENGTGKDRIAKKYHEAGARKHKPFQMIDCNTIAKEVAESELWGSVSGGFTDAVDKKGRLEEADGGVVFINEIGDLPLDLQGKWLEFMQHRKITRVGGTKAKHLDVVVVAATNKDLWEMVQKGQFRRDLYFRIFTNCVELPPLRERMEDLPALIGYFINRFNGKLKKRVEGVARDVMDKFGIFQWQGNVRQLENCLEYGMNKCHGKVIQWEDVSGFVEEELELLSKPLSAAPAIDFQVDYKSMKQLIKARSDEMLRDYLLFHLGQNNYKIKQTAEAIGVKNYQQLSEMMRDLGIQR